MKRTPIRRGRPPRRRSARNEAQIDELRDSWLLVSARSRGWCEWPGGCERAAGHFHHVKPRSKGVDHSPANLLHLCAPHHDWAHAHPREARDLGVLA